MFCLGSINADHVYAVPTLARPGETLAVDALQTGLGGKGANQSVAAARAGAQVLHIGAVGSDGDWMRCALVDHGVDVSGVAVVPGPSGHAIVMVDSAGENAILIHPGANRALAAEHVTRALGGAGSGDWLMIQNETNCQVEAAKLARSQGAQVAYSAAPFNADAVRAMLPFTDLLLMNEGEAEMLRHAMGGPPEALGLRRVIVTKGARGAVLLERGQGPVPVSAPQVAACDTTGAGDTLAGYVVAGLVAGLDTVTALHRASAAAALMVTRIGTADAIPTRAEVGAFLAGV